MQKNLKFPLTNSEKIRNFRAQKKQSQLETNPIYRFRRRFGISQRLFGELLGFSFPKIRISALEHGSYRVSRKTRLVLGVLGFIAGKGLLKELVIFLRENKLIPPRQG